MEVHSLFSVFNLEVLQEERSWKSKKYVEWYCVLPTNTFREVADQTLGADSMQDSLTFPSLKIDTESFLPQQVDDHNCDMALIAATGIIL